MNEHDHDPWADALHEQLKDQAWTPGDLPALPAQQRPGASPALAALIAAAAVLVLWLTVTITPEPEPQDATPTWAISTVSETGEAEGDLAVGDWLETDGGTRARVQVADIGTMDVSPNSRLRLKASGPDEHRLELARGEVHARVVAPPRLLVVETPAATAVDLGCEYTLAVAGDGDGRLQVTSGWVSLELPDRVAFVPHGAEAAMHKEGGPGIPVFTDAPPALRSELNCMEVPSSCAGRDPSDVLTAVLASARPRDTLSLWHVLVRGAAGQRERVFERIHELAPLEYLDSLREPVLQLDPDALDLLLLDLGQGWW